MAHLIGVIATGIGPIKKLVGLLETGAELWVVGEGGCSDALVVGGIVPTRQVDFRLPA
jgi:hypothetical protein